MNMRKLLVACLFCGIAFTLSAQQPTPPPRPAENGPTLAATMQFIQDKLNDLGRVSFVEFFQDTNDGSTSTTTDTNEITNVFADPVQCRISYHRRTTEDGRLYKDVNSTFSLRDVQNITVMPHEKANNEWNAQQGRPNLITTSTNPPIAELSAHRPHGAEDYFYFIDADLADRVARALTHAVELCGGGNKEPF